MSELVQENTRIIPDRQTSLTKEQKEAIGLLSIETFLENFDLMLYVHMAILLPDFRKKMLKDGKRGYGGGIELRNDFFRRFVVPSK